MIILALILSWLPVTLDCHGRTELAITYSVATETITLDGWATAPDGSLQPAVSRDFTEIPTVMASLALTDPHIDQAIAYWDPVAIDAAGNRSDDPCL